MDDDWKPCFDEDEGVFVNPAASTALSKASRTVSKSEILSVLMMSEDSRSNKSETSSSMKDFKGKSTVEGMSVSEQLRHFGINSQHSGAPPTPKDFLDGVDVTKLNERVQILLDQKLFRTTANHY